MIIAIRPEYFGIFRNHFFGKNDALRAPFLKCLGISGSSYFQKKNGAYSRSRGEVATLFSFCSVSDRQMGSLPTLGTSSVNSLGSQKVFHLRLRSPSRR